MQHNHKKSSSKPGEFGKTYRNKQGNSLDRKVHHFTDRPAPTLPDFHCLQAMPKSSEGLQVASYRKKLGSLEGWIATISQNCEFSTFLLKHELVDFCTAYDSQGFFMDCYDEISVKHVNECNDAVPVSRDEFTTQAREVLGNERLQLIACAEFHAGASAADRSNFTTMLARMIMNASAPDLEHVFLIESRQWPCRVSGIFANLEKLSHQQQDIYLDRHEWLDNSWPLLGNNHHEVLARMLATSRHQYMEELITRCGIAASIPISDRRLNLYYWKAASSKAKSKLANHAVACLQKGILLEQHKAEIFTEESIQEHGAAVIKDIRKILR